MRILCHILLAAACFAQTEFAQAGHDAAASADRLTAAQNDPERAALLNQLRPEDLPALQQLLEQRFAAAFRTGDYREQAALAQARLALAIRGGNTHDVATAYGDLGSAYDHLGESARAIEYLALGISIAEKNGAKAELALLRNAAGVTYRNLNRFPEAMDSLRQANSLFRELGDETGQARTMLNLGNVFQQTGDYRHAAEQYQQCLVLSRKLNATQGIAFSLNNLAQVYMHLGDDKMALDYLEQSLVLKRSLGNKADIASTLQNLSVVHQSLNQHQQALLEIEESLALGRESGSAARIADNLSNRGFSLQSLGRTEEALRNYEEALGLARKIDSLALVTEALANESALYLSQGEPDRALNLAMEAERAGRDLGLDHYLWQALNAVAEAELKLGRKREAIASYEQTIQSIERLRGQVLGGATGTERFLEQKVEPYRALIGLYIAEGRPWDALRVAERIRGRVLLDALDRGHVEITTAMTPEERRRERDLSARAADLGVAYSRQLGNKAARTRWEESQHDLEKLESELYAAHPDLRFQRADYPEFTPARAGQLALRKDQGLVEFAYAADSVFAFVLTRGESGVALAVHKLPAGPKQIEVQASRLRTQVATRDLGYRETSARLYTALLGPVENELRGKSALIVAPDGPLWRVPFAALITPQGKHLVEERAISFAPSLTVLEEEQARIRRSALAPKTLLAMGDPPAGALPALPSAAREVASLGRLYRNARVYTGDKASEERFKAEAPDYRVLHLATHGVLDDANPLYSYVVLARASGDANDGLLEARELMGLSLHADLAVLSACETADGRVASGEGLMGISWALRAAGVPATVASQWKVDSAATTALMLAFHARLQARLNTGARLTGTAQALREAALEVMRSPEYRHPFYWSAFVLVGAGQ